MKKVLCSLFLAGFFVFSFITFAFSDAQMTHVFYDEYDPYETTWVYSGATPDTSTNNVIYSTGDQVAINGYPNATLQISAPTVGEYVLIQTLGRIVGLKDNTKWAILNTTEFGSASADSEKNKTVDLSGYHVDIIKIGIRRTSAQGTSKVDVIGKFANDYK